MRKTLILLTGMTLVWFSCTKDMFVPSGFDCVEAVSYDTNIKPIIDRYCSYVGCHAGPVSYGDYTTYEGMRPYFDGRIESRVITLSSDPTIGMPPDYASGDKDLTEEDFMLINCWIAQEFPEN